MIIAEDTYPITQGGGLEFRVRMSGKNVGTATVQRNGKFINYTLDMTPEVALDIGRLLIDIAFPFVEHTKSDYYKWAMRRIGKLK